MCVISWVGLLIGVCDYCVFGIVEQWIYDLEVLSNSLMLVYRCWYIGYYLECFDIECE